LARGKEIGDNAQIFAPPALGRKNMYLCSVQGHLLSVRQDDGQVGFLYATKQPMAFQPALSGGNLYAGTTNGLLICLKTGDPDADGWTAWGGNAQHNNTEAKK
jgi:outer membrane protein assembly factor BamB